MYFLLQCTFHKRNMSVTVETAMIKTTNDSATTKCEKTIPEIDGDIKFADCNNSEIQLRICKLVHLVGLFIRTMPIAYVIKSYLH